MSSVAQLFLPRLEMRNIVGHKPKIRSKLDWESRKSRGPMKFVMEATELIERTRSIFGVEPKSSVVTPACVGVEKRVTGTGCFMLRGVSVSQASKRS